MFFLMKNEVIWGCPSPLARVGLCRSSQVCSAHRFFALLKSSVWPSATAIHPSASRFAPLDHKNQA